MPVPSEEKYEYFNKERCIYDETREYNVDNERLREIMSIINIIYPIYINITAVYRENQ